MNSRHNSKQRSPSLTLFSAVLLAGAQVLTVSSIAGAQGDEVSSGQAVIEVQSLDGSGNNLANPTWGKVGGAYARVTASHYADGRSQPQAGPNSRFVSNRIHQDEAQNIFSERGVTQWGFVWGQFLDHTFGLRQDSGGQAANIPFNAADPLEKFRNDLGVVPFTRSDAAPGTGVTNPREQVNTVSSYIDAWPVYGGTAQRLEWLRNGPLDNNMSNNSAQLMLPGGYLPTRESRGNPAGAPRMDLDGRLLGVPNHAMIAGDVRANENIALTATHTLFAREHNRIVSLLPAGLSEEDKFQIARRMVIAEQQFITYNEFLPAVGVQVPAYTGYKPGVNATLSNEFATVGYRAHSMIHGEIELESDAARYSQADLDFFRSQGMEVDVEGDEAALAVPLNVAFFNPDLVPKLQLGPLLEAIGDESEYRNDEQIDNQLRSTLFQIPVPGNPDCLDGPALPECFHGVVDLGAIDIERGRDHGMPSYNQLRQAYGLPARTSFTAITGEASESFPADPVLTPGNESNDPNSLDFTRLRDLFNLEVDPASVAAANTVTNATRRTPVAARLKAIYGNVNNVDAFVGMLAERHVTGADMGELQRAIWTREFARLRDGDRFFYGNDPGLTFIRNQYGIDFRRNLGDLIALNTDIPRADLAPNVFFTGGDVPPASCAITYRVVDQWPTGFRVDMSITNTGSVPLNNWALRFTFANGQVISLQWNGVATQDGARVPITNASWNSALAPGQKLTDIGFVASWNGSRNDRPTAFTLNTTPCSSG